MKKKKKFFSVTNSRVLQYSAGTLTWVFVSGWKARHFPDATCNTHAWYTHTHTAVTSKQKDPGHSAEVRPDTNIWSEADRTEG